MKRMNVANEFTRLQRESQRAVELLGNLLPDRYATGVDPQAPPQFATRSSATVRDTVFTYLRK